MEPERILVKLSTAQDQQIQLLPKEKYYGISYETVRASFENIEKSYQERKCPNQNIIRYGFVMTGIIGLAGFGLMSLIIGLNVSSGDVSAANLAYAPLSVVPITIFSAAVGARYTGIKISAALVRRKIELIDSWTDNKDLLRAVPHYYLNQLSESITPENPCRYPQVLSTFFKYPLNLVYEQLPPLRTYLSAVSTPSRFFATQVSRRISCP